MGPKIFRGFRETGPRIEKTKKKIKYAKLMVVNLIEYIRVLFYRQEEMLLFQVLELICTREAGAVFEAGGLQCSLTFIREFGSAVHKDTLHSAMNVVTRLCGRMEPQDTNLETCVKSLSTLLKHEDPYVSTKSLLTVSI